MTARKRREDTIRVQVKFFLKNKRTGYLAFCRGITSALHKKYQLSNSTAFNKPKLGKYPLGTWLTGCSIRHLSLARLVLEKGIMNLIIETESDSTSEAVSIISQFSSFKGASL